MKVTVRSINHGSYRKVSKIRIYSFKNICIFYKGYTLVIYVGVIKKNSFVEWFHICRAYVS